MKHAATLRGRQRAAVRWIGLRPARFTITALADANGLSWLNAAKLVEHLQSIRFVAPLDGGGYVHTDIYPRKLNRAAVTEALRHRAPKNVGQIVGDAWERAVVKSGIRDNWP